MSTAKAYSVATCVAAALLLVSCSTGSSKTSVNVEHRVSDDRKPAPDFTLTDANGNSVKLSDYRGKVVLLNFWATWCGPCAIEIPWFIEFEQAYKSRGFEVLGVSMDDEGWKAVKPFVTEHKINYRVALGNDSVAQLYGGIDSLPTTFIIDRAGKIAYPPHVGLVGRNEYVNQIESLLDAHQQTMDRRLVRLMPGAVVLGAAK